MRLLICTQAVDLDDPVLGFFHRWLEEISKHSETVHVICLKEGRHDLPKNVFVHSLGKESGRSRIKYLTRFFRYIREFRSEYDAVFVHMNAEYVVLGGLLWRLWGKRIGLWRNHKQKSFFTSIAVRLSEFVCYTSPEAFVARFKNSVQMPIGIDTIFFTPSTDAKSDSFPRQTRSGQKSRYVRPRTRATARTDRAILRTDRWRPDGPEIELCARRAQPGISALSRRRSFDASCRDQRCGARPLSLPRDLLQSHALGLVRQNDRRGDGCGRSRCCTK